MNFDELQSVCKLYNIRTKNKEKELLFCAADVGAMLKIKYIHRSTENFYENEKCLLKEDTPGGMQIMSFLTLNGLRRLVSSSRKSEASNFAKSLNIDVNTYKNECIETTTINSIIEYFQTETCLLQHKCGSYIIDLYFPDYKLSVECDERHHGRSDNKEKDETRQNYIEEKLGATFIRYSPHDTNFNISKVIVQIHDFIQKKKDNVPDYKSIIKRQKAIISEQKNIIEELQKKIAK